MGGLRFLAYDRWGIALGDITDEIDKAKWKQQINHKDLLTITCQTLLTKGDRILWYYNGRWHENVVSSTEQTHDEGETLECDCEWNVMEDLQLAHIRQCVMSSVTAHTALSTILGQTTWKVGAVDDLGTKSFSFSLTNAYKALLEIVGEYGAEIRVDLETDGYGVSKRSISLLRQIGEAKPNRFEYGYNMEGVEKEVSGDPVYTAAYGYGKTLDSETDDIQDRLMFSVNGKPYVEDLDALELWGLSDGSGGKMHSFGYYENSECEDANQLLAETKSYLAENNTPKVSYKTDIYFAQLEGVELGDSVQVTDTDFTPPLRLEARIGAMTCDLISGKTSSVEFGNVTSIVPDMLARSWTASNAVAKAANSSAASASMAYQQAQAVGEIVKGMGNSITTQEFKLVGVDDGGNQVTAVLTVNKDGVLCIDGQPIGITT